MSSSTRAACVIGYPAKHSRSPKLHGHWLERHGVDGDYRIEEIAPENFEAFLLNFSANGYIGANVTMPHKDEALRLSVPDEKATKIGAANTLWLDQGTLRSTNTDCDGFVGALDSASPGWDKRTSSAVVLGCGGAGRAVIYGLLDRGISTVNVVNRTYAKAADLRDAYGSSIEPAHWMTYLNCLTVPIYWSIPHRLVCKASQVLRLTFPHSRQTQLFPTLFMYLLKHHC